MATFTKGSQGGVCEAVASHLSSEKYFVCLVQLWAGDHMHCLLLAVVVMDKTKHHPACTQVSRLVAFFPWFLCCSQ